MTEEMVNLPALYPEIYGGMSIEEAWEARNSGLTNIYVSTDGYFRQISFTEYFQMIQRGETPPPAGLPTPEQWVEKYPHLDPYLFPEEAPPEVPPPPVVTYTPGGEAWIPSGKKPQIQLGAWLAPFAIAIGLLYGLTNKGRIKHGNASRFRRTSTR